MLENTKITDFERADMKRKNMEQYINLEQTSLEHSSSEHKGAELDNTKNIDNPAATESTVAPLKADPISTVFNTVTTLPTQPSP
jgi:hypothetical protein